MRAKLRDLDGLAPEAALELYINDAWIGALDRVRNRADLHLASRQGGCVPTIAAGDKAEIRAGELVLNRGTFLED